MNPTDPFFTQVDLGVNNSNGYFLGVRSNNAMKEEEEKKLGETSVRGCSTPEVASVVKDTIEAAVSLEN